MPAEKAEALQFLGLTALQRGRADDAVRDIAVAGFGMGQQADKGIVHIRRRQGRAVAEAHILPQVEGISSPVVGNLPGFGQRGLDHDVSVGAAFHLHQTVEDVLRDRIVDGGALEVHGIRLILHADKKARGIQFLGRILPSRRPLRRSQHARTESGRGHECEQKAHYRLLLNLMLHGILLYALRQHSRRNFKMRNSHIPSRQFNLSAEPS